MNITESRLDKGVPLWYNSSIQSGDVMSKVNKTCVICNKGFAVISSRAESAKTCGLECRGKLIAKKYEDDRSKLKCKACGGAFSVPTCHEARRSYCSMECADAHRNDNMGRGSEANSWKGGRVKHSGGYIYIQSMGHPYATSRTLYVFEHRLVTEDRMRVESPGHKFLIEIGGVKYLRQEIQVHHVDEDRQNNAPSNLLACTAQAHRAIHNGGAPVTGEVWPEIEGTIAEHKSFEIKFTKNDSNNAVH